MRSSNSIIRISQNRIWDHHHSQAPTLPDQSVLITSHLIRTVFPANLASCFVQRLLWNSIVKTIIITIIIIQPNHEPYANTILQRVYKYKLLIESSSSLIRGNLDWELFEQAFWLPLHVWFYDLFDTQWLLLISPPVWHPSQPARGWRGGSLP